MATRTMKIKNGIVAMLAVAVACVAAGMDLPETDFWQGKIDAVASMGGGKVTVPAGRHVVGQLDLRSNVELHLEKDAVLEGMVGLEHYRIVPLPFSEGLVWSAIVMAVSQTNVAITGHGQIYGNGTAWPQPEVYGNHEGRRARGILFADCVGVRLEDFTLRDTACWGCVFKCCDGVTARRVTIDNHGNLNNDGFDIEARNVVIEDCDVDSGDDAFCLKSNNPDFSVENVIVRNCIGRSHCNAFKLGTASHGTMRNVRFENCRSAAPRRDFVDTRPSSPNFGKCCYTRGVRCGYPHGTGQAAIAIENVDGGVVEDVVFENIEAFGCRVPLFIRGGTRAGRPCGTPPGDKYVFRNIKVRHVRGEALFGLASSITGVDGCRVKDVLLEDIDVVCAGAGAEESAAALSEPVPYIPGAYPDAVMFKHLLPAYGLYVDRVDGLSIDSVSFRLRRESNDCRRAVFLTGN